MVKRTKRAERAEKAKKAKGAVGLRIFLGAALFAAALLGVQNLLTPKYMTSLWEGSMVREYYSASHENQVIFIGDCEVYGNFSTVALWEEYGITSYIRGGPNQLIWQSYYLLEDTLRIETPDVVVLSVLAVKDDARESEAYNRLNIDGMRLTSAKIGAIEASMGDDESMLSYLLPLLRYHDRWDELSMEDLQYYFRRDKVTHNGYYMRCDVEPVGVVPSAPRLMDYMLPERSMEYLDRIRILCESKGVELVLIKAPSIYPFWYDEWDNQISGYAEEHGLRYFNILKAADEVGIDFSTDTFDAGLHMNKAGAEKVSKWFGAKLSETYGFEDKRKDKGVVKVWEAIARDYEAMAQAQMDDIEKEGKVSTFTFVPSG